MKKLCTFLSILVAVVALNAQTITDGFESYEDFAINPVGIWTFIDVSPDSTYAIEYTVFQNAFSPMAFMVFNPTETEPPMTLIAAHGGSKVLASFAEMTPPNNDWIISPDLGFASGTLNFWARSYNNRYGLERMKVGYSTTTTDPAAFTFIQTGNYVEVPIEWTEYTYIFPEGTKYVAINCVSDKAFIFFIDDISITYTVGVNETAKENVSIHPNPVNDILHVTANGYNKVEILNFLGQVILSENVTNSNFEVNVSDFNSGVYFVRLQGENGTITKKFVKK